MTREETKNIIRVMVGTWPNYSPKDLTETVDIWHMMIGDLDYHVAQAALKAYAQNDTSGFAPSVGQIRAKAVELTAEEDLSEGEAWGLVRRAIANSIYGAEKEFQALPEVVREAVGSYGILRTWAMMEEADLDYARGSFMKNFAAVKTRKKERLSLSDDLKAILDKRPTAQIQQAKQEALPEAKIPEEERIGAAERAAERIRR